jgi:hypothetical protein
VTQTTIVSAQERVEIKRELIDSLRVDALHKYVSSFKTSNKIYLFPNILSLPLLLKLSYLFRRPSLFKKSLQIQVERLHTKTFWEITSQCKTI